jgi:hypothetical protein
VCVSVRESAYEIVSLSLTLSTNSVAVSGMNPARVVMAAPKVQRSDELELHHLEKSLCANEQT